MMTLAVSSENDQTWSSGFTFILAAVGAVVGLGNIWRFRKYLIGPISTATPGTSARLPIFDPTT